VRPPGPFRLDASLQLHESPFTVIQSTSPGSGGGQGNAAARATMTAIAWSFPRLKKRSPPIALTISRMSRTPRHSSSASG
jgi:hypothetical protein